MAAAEREYCEDTGLNGTMNAVMADGGMRNLDKVAVIAFSAKKTYLQRSGLKSASMKAGWHRLKPGLSAYPYKEAQAKAGEIIGGLGALQAGVTPAPVNRVRCDTLEGYLEAQVNDLIRVLCESLLIPEAAPIRHLGATATLEDKLLAAHAQRNHFKAGIGLVKLLWLCCMVIVPTMRPMKEVLRDGSREAPGSGGRHGLMPGTAVEMGVVAAPASRTAGGGSGGRGQYSGDLT